MDAHPGLGLAPLLHSALGVVTVDEMLAGEEGGPHIGHRPLHPGLRFSKASSAARSSADIGGLARFMASQASIPSGSSR